MIVKLFTLQCDSCGKRSKEHRTSEWQARDAASQRDWLTKSLNSEHDLCRECAQEKLNQATKGVASP